MAGARRGLGLPALAALLVLAHFAAAERHLAQRDSFVELQQAISVARHQARLTLEEEDACLDDPFCAGKLDLGAQLTVNSGGDVTINAGGSGKKCIVLDAQCLAALVPVWSALHLCTQGAICRLQVAALALTRRAG